MTKREIQHNNYDLRVCARGRLKFPSPFLSVTLILISSFMILIKPCASFVPGVPNHNLNWKPIPSQSPVSKVNNYDLSREIFSQMKKNDRKGSRRSFRSSTTLQLHFLQDLHLPTLTLSNDLNTILQSNPIITQVIESYSTSPYPFMLPVAIFVSSSCQLAGIGGAALFSPIFLLIFPFFGLELNSPAQAVASALLTEVFGFASGLYGFSRRGLVDWQIASKFMLVSIPSALIGALLAKTLAEDILLLRVLYASLMISLCIYLIVSPRPEALEAEENCEIPGLDTGIKTLTAADGTLYTYLLNPKSSNSDVDNDENDQTQTNSSDENDIKGIGATFAGSTLTGLLGVGVGEVILPQLVRGRCMPLPVAAGTSVAVVVVTAMTAAVVQFLSLALSVATPSEIDGSINLASAFLDVIPWKLVQFTIPGVLIGGQVAPFLASRGNFSDEQIENFAATLFGIVGVAFAAKVITG